MFFLLWVQYGLFADDKICFFGKKSIQTLFDSFRREFLLRKELFMIIANKVKIPMSSFSGADELKNIIFENPDILNDDMKLVQIKKDVLLKESNSIDILMMTSSGNISVVVVKLSEKHESRREITAQIMELVSVLSEYSFKELDCASDGKLSEAAGLTARAAELEKVIDNDLKLGKIKIFIAADKADENLRKAAAFISEHTDFDITLTEIKKYKNKENEILVSDEVFISSEFSDAVKETGDPKNSELELKFNNDSEPDIKENPVIEILTEKWNSKHPNSLLSGEDSDCFRQISIKGWPEDVHYEFNISGGNIQIRLDNELSDSHDLKKPVSDLLDSFKNISINNFDFSCRSLNDKGNSKFLFSEVEINDTDTAVMVMEQLINKTIENVYRLVNDNNK